MSLESTLAIWLIGGVVLILMVALLIGVRRARLKPDGKELILAITSGRLVKLCKLLKKGADINFRDHDQRTPLMVAAMQGRVEIVSILTKNGADINAIDKEGNTAIALALQNKKDDVVRFLKNIGAMEPDPV